MEKPPGETPPAPRPRDDLGIHVHRCPYCRDDVTAAEGVVCRECLTRHHPGCWSEAGRCSSCGGTAHLVGAPQGRACMHPACDAPAGTTYGFVGYCAAHARALARREARIRSLVAALCVLLTPAMLVSAWDLEEPAIALIGGFLLLLAGFLHFARPKLPPDPEGEERP